MKYVLLAILLVAAVGVCSQPTQACFCILPELSDSLTQSRSVFLGEAIQLTEPKTLDPKAPLAERAFIIKFKIVRSWKGVPSATSEFSILWLTNCYECLALPRVNEQYLVFANPVRDNATWSIVSMCNRTVGIRSDSNLANPEIDPDRDMKALDVINKRAFMFTPRTIGNAYNKSLDASGGSLFRNIIGPAVLD